MLFVSVLAAGLASATVPPEEVELTPDSVSDDSAHHPASTVLFGRGPPVGHGERSVTVFGEGGMQTRANNGLQLEVSSRLNNTLISWAAALPQGGLALCDERNSKLLLWLPDGTFAAIGLAPLKVPVGAVYLEGKVYVACFGTWPLPRSDSGLAVVDVASLRLQATYPYAGVGRPNGSEVHLHNAYAFDWDCRPEIFVAVVGNPWTHPPVAGHGLVRFDLETGTFHPWSTVAFANIRSAVQQSEGVFFALTQAPAKQPSQLLRLEKHGNHLLQVAATPLPSREGGDGGADVLLADEKDAVFATDRDLTHGWVHYYQYKSGGFHLQTSHMTGNHPRHAAVLPSGDVLVCNRFDGTLTSFPGLARHPLKKVQPVVVEVMPSVSFVLPGDSAKHGTNEWSASEPCSSTGGAHSGNNLRHGHANARTASGDSTSWKSMLRDLGFIILGMCIAVVYASICRGDPRCGGEAGRSRRQARVSISDREF
jgi:hypothetical protein